MYRFLIHPDQIYCKCNRKVHYDMSHVGWKIIDVVDSRGENKAQLSRRIFLALFSKVYVDALNVNVGTYVQKCVC